jgi:uncharacterized protein (TIRG00374 family)
MRRRFFALVRIVAPIAIIGWLFYTLSRDDPQTFTRLLSRPKNWGLLASSAALVTTAVCVTFARWYLLVRALDIPFRLIEAFRLGFLGYLLNFVSFGSVGGDLFKAYFLARDRPGRRPEAVATVVLDRLIGLYALLLVASAGLLAMGPQSFDTAVTLGVRRTTLLATAIASAGLVALPLLSHGLWVKTIARVPKIGPMFARLATAVELYRRKLGVLLVVVVMSMAVHLCNVAGLYALAAGLFSEDEIPTLARQLVIMPLALLAGAIPITPAGVGTFEFAVDYLYRHFARTEAGQGLVVALAYRVMTIVIATIGIGYYWASRKEVAAAMEAAEHEDERL